MEVILSTDGVDTQECDLLVSGVFEDERPLKGGSGWVDWRLNGRVSRLLIDGKLTGHWKESTLIPTQGRMVPPLVLLLGLGRAMDYSYLRLRELSPYLLGVLQKLGLSRVCLSLPYDLRYNVDGGKLAEVLLEGVADSLGHRELRVDEEWVRGLQLSFAEDSAHQLEFLLGIQTAQSLLAEKLKIRILMPTRKPSVPVTSPKA